MSDNGGSRIRVILRWIQIKDNKEAPWDDEGEFRFRSRITTGGASQELVFPDSPAFWSISDHPSRNKVDKIDKVLFEGEAGDSLVVELAGVELDSLSTDDVLEPYRREFSGPADSWIGTHLPSDEGGDDPENLSDWRVCYEIEAA